MITPVTVKAEFDKEHGARFEKAARVFPKETYRALGQVGSVIRNRMRKVTGKSGGMFGVPSMKPHHQLTTFLHGEHQIGGKLALPYMVQMYRSGGQLTVGYISAVTAWAKSVQEEERRPTSVAERAMFHRRVGKQHGVIPVPMIYNRPKRDVVDSFYDFHKTLIPEWILGALTKAMERSINNNRSSREWAFTGI